MTYEPMETKMHSDDRVIELTPVDGKKPLSGTGITDARLFTGENKLHAVRDETGLWSLKYEQGSIPEVLKQRFTNFNALKDFAERYYKRRNILVKEIVDAQAS